MKIFHTFESIPSRIIGLLRLLEREPTKGMRRSVVVSLFQPLPIQTIQGTDPINEVIGAALELGVVVEEKTRGGDSRLRIGSDFMTVEDGSTFDDRVPRFLAEAALKSQPNSEPNLFAKACAWLLRQDPVSMPQGHGELKNRLEADGLSLDELGLRNDARWDMLVYWTTYLGFSWQTQQRKCHGIVPDPSTYLVRHLDHLLKAGSSVPVHEFRNRLGELCPVLDGGLVNQQVSEILASSGVLSARFDDNLSPALSFALRHLKAGGIIDYWCPDDQRTFLLMSRDEKIAYVSRSLVTSA